MIKNETDKLKIAVQFFGHLRTFRKCAPSIEKHLLSKYDCDVFMHTWNKTEHDTCTWHNNKSRILDVNEKLLSVVQRLYKPKGLLVEEQKPAEERLLRLAHDNGQTQISVAGIRFMLSSMKKADDLRLSYAEQNNVHYDYVITLRPDIFLKKTFDFNLLQREEKLQPDLLWRFYAVNPDSEAKNFIFASDLASDIITIARPEVMTQSITVLNNTDFSQLLQEDVWCPENLFIGLLAQTGIFSVPLAYYCRTDWRIERAGSYKKQPLYKKFIRLSLHKAKFYFHLFSGMAVPVFRLTAALGNKNIFDFKVGKYDE